MIISHDKIVVIIFFTSLLGLSFFVPGVPSTWAIFSIFIIFFGRSNVDLTSIVFMMLTCVYFLIFAALVSDADLIEFFKSFSNFILFCVIVLLVSKSSPNLDYFIFVLKIFTRSIFFFAFAQSMSFYFLGSDYLFFVLDPISISTADDIGRFEAVNFLGYMRPYASYHEPSFLALVANFLFYARYCLKREFDLFAIGTIVLSLSIVGILTLLISIWLFSSVRLKFIFGSAIFFVFIYFSEFFRFAEILRPGTSGYERIGVIWDTILELESSNLFPIILGNFEKMPNNSIQVIIGYFGPFSILVISFLMFRSNFKGLGVLFGLLMTNGAFFTPNGGFLLGLFWLVSRFEKFLKIKAAAHARSERANFG